MFSNPKKIVDRWVGTEPIRLHDGIIDTLAYTFRVIGDALQEEQIEEAHKILGEYESIWESISPKLKWKNFNNRLLLFMPARVGNSEFEFMLGYESSQNGVLKSAFFAFNGSELVFEHVDH